MPRPGRTIPAILLAPSLSLLLLALPGCATRVPVFSPRLPPTEDHLAARQPSDCLGCHDAPSLRPDHSPKDPCRKCHKICYGRYE